MGSSSWWTNVSATSNSANAFFSNVVAKPYVYQPVVVMPTNHGQPPATLHEPWFAAQQLRTLLRDAVALEENAGTYNYLGAAARGQLKGYDVAIIERVQKIENELIIALKEIKERKAKDPMARITQCQEHLQMIRNQATTSQMRIDGFSKPKAKAPDQVQRLKLCFEYAQSLPTVPDLPTTAAENTLRAIVALLRHHNWPDTKGLNVKEVKENGEANIAQQLEQVAAQVGQPVPVGAAPGYDTPGEDVESDDEYDPDDE